MSTSRAPGFYVLRDTCLSCAAPEYEAPGLVTTDGDGCRWLRQPETDEEVFRAINAMVVSCIEAHRYGGSDPEILQRIAEAGAAGLCDHPLPGHARVVRDHVRFDLEGVSDVEEAAEAIARHVPAGRGWPCRRRRSPGTIVLRGASWRPTETLVVQAIQAPTWLAVIDSMRSVWLHDALVASHAMRIRWFSTDEWSSGSVGQPFPY